MAQRELLEVNEFTVMRLIRKGVWTRSEILARSHLPTEEMDRVLRRLLRLRLIQRRVTGGRAEVDIVDVGELFVPR